MIKLNAGTHEGKLDYSYAAGGNEKGTAFWKRVWNFLQN